MEAIPKLDIKSFIKSDIRFHVSIKQTAWIGHKDVHIKVSFAYLLLSYSKFE